VCASRCRRLRRRVDRLRVAAADVEVLQQNVAGAFGRLITLIKRTAGDERTKVRERLIELFDPADPEVIAGRRKLANALY
jgi:putative thioredoxin